MLCSAKTFEWFCPVVIFAEQTLSTPSWKPAPSFSYPADGRIKHAQGELPVRTRQVRYYRRRFRFRTRNNAPVRMLRRRASRRRNRDIVTNIF